MLDILNIPRNKNHRVDLSQQIRKNKNLKISEDQSSLASNRNEQLLATEISIFNEFLITLENVDALGDYSLDLNNDDIVQILVEKNSLKKKAICKLNEKLLAKLGVKHILISPDSVSSLQISLIVLDIRAL